MPGTVHSLVHTPLYQHHPASKAGPPTCRALLPHLRNALRDMARLTQDDQGLCFYGVPERAERVIRLNSLNLTWIMPA